MLREAARCHLKARLCTWCPEGLPATEFTWNRQKRKDTLCLEGMGASTLVCDFDSGLQLSCPVEEGCGAGGGGAGDSSTTVTGSQPCHFCLCRSPPRWSENSNERGLFFFNFFETSYWLFSLISIEEFCFRIKQPGLVFLCEFRSLLIWIPMKRGKQHCWNVGKGLLFFFFFFGTLSL